MFRLQQHHDNRYTACDGRLYLERRPHLSPYWQLRTSFEGRQATRTTSCADLRSAAEWAEKWWIEFQYKRAKGEPIESRRTLATAFKDFIKWHEKLVGTGESNEQKLQRYRATWNNIKNDLGKVALERVNFDALQTFKDARVERAKPRKLTGKTLNADLGLIRMVLKYSVQREWLRALPTFPTSPVDHVSPDWFTVQEYSALVAASRQRCEQVRATNPHHYFERRELHAFILMMAHSCIRVNECLDLRWSDCLEAPENRKLQQYRAQTVQLRIRDGKVGYRQALGMFGAVRALQILRQLNPAAASEDRLFKSSHAQAFENLLKSIGLRRDLKGRLRNQKTLRHTSIMMRCLFNPTLSTADLSVISGTSMTSLEKYYLRHLKAAHVQRRLIDKALAVLEAETKQ